LALQVVFYLLENLVNFKKITYLCNVKLRNNKTLLYRQVNFRPLLTSVRVGNTQHRAAVQGEYVRVGVYHAHAVVTVNYHHFAVEEIGKELYFFAPKAEQKVDAVQDNTNVNAKMQKTALSSFEDKHEKQADNHEALVFKKIGDIYAPYALSLNDGHRKPDKANS
jgi:hypothetical protein